MDDKNKPKNKKFTKRDVTKNYDEGDDSYPMRDTFRNVLDSNLTGTIDDKERE